MDLIISSVGWSISQPMLKSSSIAVDDHFRLYRAKSNKKGNEGFFDPSTKKTTIFNCLQMPLYEKLNVWKTTPSKERHMHNKIHLSRQQERL